MGNFIKLLFSIIIFIFLSFYCAFPFQIVSHELEYALYKKNQLIWSFKTKEFFQKETGDFEGKDIYLINKEKGLKIWANKGFYQKWEDKFILQDNVHLVTSEYGEVYTQKLIFYPKKNLIFTDEEVILIKKGLTVKGKGLIYEIETGNFKVEGKAKVKWKI
uniref:LPS export ABC transporter periplasmic protein LptC n=1 Tax=Thermodesulfobacterium geofontis TaxID=1295609 RepID=A0A7V6CEM4_9BACT